jgi:colanic acid/amylovoran biosynthesis protein
MFGQGIGPLKNASLLRKVSQVLPRLNVLGLREDLTSLEIIKSLNVSQEHVFITGDDAIEVAVQMINPDIEKKCIGVNIRQDYYAGNFKNLLPEIGTIIKSISESHHAPIIPLPIYLGEPNSDLSSITQMCDLDMIEYQLSEHIITPEDIIRQISRCKVVITGSYHAGVFALAQGIPVVALVGSDYYAAKFYGLAKQFEAGCQVEMLRSKNLIDRFRYSIEYSMQMQNEYEPKLINSAKQQVKQSRAAWEHFLVHMPS